MLFHAMYQVKRSKIWERWHRRFDTHNVFLVRTLGCCSKSSLLDMSEQLDLDLILIRMLMLIDVGAIP